MRAPFFRRVFVCGDALTLSNRTRINTLVRGAYLSTNMARRKGRARAANWVTSVALCNRRRPVDFRYAPFATEDAWRCNMSRMGPTTDNRSASFTCLLHLLE